MKQQSAAYEQTLEYLYTQLPMFSKQGKDAIKKDLTNIRALCQALGNPQDRLRFIHIAGTNGKGSTSHGLAAILEACGYKTGLYTSPHLIDFRERIRINGEMISQEMVVAFTEKHKPLFEEIKPSFFEVTVVMAFAAFAEAGVDIAVIETGLGGRLDSTNIITPILSIITNISYDHMDVLGNTLEEIAREKAGIIKPGIPVLIGEQQKETESIFFETAIHQKSTVYYAEAMWDLVRSGFKKGMLNYKAVQGTQQVIHTLSTDLQGKYQLQNLRTILAAAELLPAISDMEISIPVALKALGSIKELTGLRGRWEVLQQQPLVIADVAHNVAGIKSVLTQFAGLIAAQKHIVIGFVRDKDVAEVLTWLPRSNKYYFCNADIPRALPAAELAKQAKAAGVEGETFPSVAMAVQAAMVAMQQEDALLITGSFFVVGEALEAVDWNNS